MSRIDVAIVGGGAAGFFAAICLKEANPKLSVSIFEATRKPLAKVLMSGGGRCNVTHACFDPKALVKHYPRGARELIGPFYHFGPTQMIDWLQRHGVSLHTEKDGRMFPVTNKSQTIISCFMDTAAEAGVKVMLGSGVRHIESLAEGSYELTLKDESQVLAKHLVMTTGSAPAGHQLIESLGHEIIDAVPSLFTFKISHKLLEGMAGQSFSKAQLKLKIYVEGKNKAQVFTQSGPLLVTHWGLSGPAVLKLSAFAARELHASKYKAELSINFMPESTNEAQRSEWLSTQQKSPNKSLMSLKPSVFSNRFWQQLLSVVGINHESLVGAVSKAQLSQLAHGISDFKCDVDGKGVFKEEFVTCGGVKRSEIDFRRMESKVHPRLYFSGEVIDIDGITGGFNFQNAWTGSWLLAQAIAQEDA